MFAWIYESRTIRSLIILALGLAATRGIFADAPAPRPAAPAPAPIERVRLDDFASDLEALREQLRIPALSAAIVHDRTVIWARGFGFADFERKVPATVNTPYGLASLTKVFTSTLLLGLLESRQFDLDEPMSKYCPAFTGNPALVRHVMSHTSDGTPGDQFQYNSDRYGMLDQLVLKVTGTPYRVLLARTVLDPLRMASTVPGADFEAAEARGDIRLDPGSRERYRKVVAGMAKPYKLYGDGETVRTAFPAPQIDAASGLVSTVMDLARFDAALDDHRFVSPETQDKAWSPAVANSGQSLPYGLGWFVEDFHGTKLVWHYGYLPDSYASLYLKVPSASLSLIILANSDALSAPFFATPAVETSAFACRFLRRFIAEGNGGTAPAGPGDAASAAAQAVGGDAAGAAARGAMISDLDGCEATARDAIAAWLADRRTSVRKVVGTSEPDLRGCAGRYQLRTEGVLTVTLSRGALWIDMPQDVVSELFPMGPDRFFLKTMDLELDFVRGAGGEVTSVRLTGNGATVTAARIPSDPARGR